jgi:hypothetical protein
MSEWATIAIADTHFTTRAGKAMTAWPPLTDPVKQAYLTTSYNRIYYDPQWSISATPTAAQLDILQKSQCELAWYFYIHVNDEDRRKGIQAQGVIEAGIVGEVYEKEYLDKLPYPPFVVQLLDGFATHVPFAVTEIGRDEDLDVDDTSVVD